MTPQGAMVFAAGFGTRMMPLTRDKPKPMISVAGRPLIDIALEHVAEAGASPVVVNSHYQADVLREHLKDRPITLLHEAPDILDTGGGLRNALAALGAAPVWTINPDVIWAGPNPLIYALEHWDPDRMESLLVCVAPERSIGTESPGDFSISSSGRLTRGPGFLYGGVQILKTRRLSDVSERVFSLNRLWDIHIEQGTCFGVEYPGHWCDVGTPAGIPLAEGLLKRNV